MARNDKEITSTGMRCPNHKEEIAKAIAFVDGRAIFGCHKCVAQNHRVNIKRKVRLSTIGEGL